MRTKAMFNFLTRFSVVLGIALLGAGCGGTDSGIPTLLKPNSVLLEAGKLQGVKIEGGSSSGSQDGYSTEIERRYPVTFSSGTAGQLLAAYHAKVENIITNAGAEIHGRGTTGYGTTNISDFSFHYSWHRVEGIIKLYSFTNASGQLEIIFLCFEYR